MPKRRAVLMRAPTLAGEDGEALAHAAAAVGPALPCPSPSPHTHHSCRHYFTSRFNREGDLMFSCGKVRYRRARKRERRGMRVRDCEQKSENSDRPATLSRPCGLHPGRPGWRDPACTPPAPRAGARPRPCPRQPCGERDHSHAPCRKEEDHRQHAHDYILSHSLHISFSHIHRTTTPTPGSPRTASAWATTSATTARWPRATSPPTRPSSSRAPPTRRPNCGM